MKPTNSSHLAFLVRARSTRRVDEKGFTLIEVLVAFFILALVAAAALPLMARSIQSSSLISTSTAANQRVQEKIELVRVVPVTCVKINAQLGTQEFTDGRGNRFRVTTTAPGGCTITANAQTVNLRIVTRRSGDNKLMTDLTTKIFVPGIAA